MSRQPICHPICHLIDRHQHTRPGRRTRLALVAGLAAGALALSACDRQPEDVARGGPADQPQTVADVTIPGNPPPGLGTPPTATAQGMGMGDSTARAGGAMGDPLDEMPPTAAGGSAALAEADRSFLGKAAQGSLFEVAAGHLAQQKGQRPEVKAFGAKLTTDHSAAGADLQQLASRKGVQLPQDMSPTQRSALERLQAASGAQFDTEFVRAVGVHAHQQDIAAFEQAGKTAQDADVKAFAQKTLPTLNGHLETARQLQGDAATATEGTRAAN